MFVELLPQWTYVNVPLSENESLPTTEPNDQY